MHLAHAQTLFASMKASSIEAAIEASVHDRPTKESRLQANLLSGTRASYLHKSRLQLDSSSVRRVDSSLMIDGDELTFDEFTKRTLEHLQQKSSQLDENTNKEMLHIKTFYSPKLHRRIKRSQSRTSLADPGIACHAPKPPPEVSKVRFGAYRPKKKKSVFKSAHVADPANSHASKAAGTGEPEQPAPEEDDDDEFKTVIHHDNWTKTLQSMSTHHPQVQEVKLRCTVELRINSEDKKQTDHHFNERTMNQHNDVFVNVEFCITDCGYHSVTATGYYAGNHIFVVRFSPRLIGDWSYTVHSNLSRVDGHKGTVRCMPDTSASLHVLQKSGAFLFLGANSQQKTAKKKPQRRKVRVVQKAKSFSAQDIKILKQVLKKWHMFAKLSWASSYDQRVASQLQALQQSIAEKTTAIGSLKQETIKFAKIVVGLHRDCEEAGHTFEAAVCGAQKSAIGASTFDLPPTPETPATPGVIVADPYLHAERSRGSGDYAKALLLYEEAIARDEHPLHQCFYQCGVCLHALGKYQDAIKQFDRALEGSDPSITSMCYHNRALSLYELGRKAAAAADLELALEQPVILHRDETAMLLASINREQEVPEAAAQAYQEGQKRFNSSEFVAAADSYDEAIALGHPDKARIYTCRGLCHVWMGEDSSAIRYFSKAIDADPQDVSSVYNRAQAYRSTCMWDLAAADARRVVELAPLENDFGRLLTLIGDDVAANHIQAIGRGFLLRKRLGKINQAATRIQATFRRRMVVRRRQGRKQKGRSRKRVSTSTMRR